jgi:hypothetical protein
MRAESGWRAEPVPAWRPRELSPERWSGLLVSGDRVLATYVDWSSGIGMGFCLDLDAGELVWVTPPHPTGERAIAGRGRFLVGEQGYGAFATRLYDRDGAVINEWPSHGGLLVSRRGRVRVVEADNGDTMTRRLRRLHRDGSMTDGPHVPGYYTVGPVLSGDGRAAWWRGGELALADPDLNVNTAYEGAKEDEGVDRMLLMEGGRLFFVLTRDWVRGTSALVIAHTDLAPLDTGAWPCGEGGLPGNPVRA